MRECIAVYGSFEVMRHLATGMFEVWSPSLRLCTFISEHRAREWAAAYDAASK